MEQLLTAYKSEKRLMIRNLLTIYKELSLTELAEHMQMSKTAVHHHLKILRDCQVVEVSREEEAQGSIDRKYFQLAKGQRHFDVENLSQIEDPVRRCQIMKNMVKTLQVVYREVTNRMELMVNFTQYLADELNKLDATNPDQSELAALQAELSKNNTHLRNIPLSKKQFEDYKQLTQEFFDNVKGMKEKTGEDNSPYLGILIDMPIQSLLEFNIDQM